MNSNGHRKLNKIVMRYCVKCYVKCWKHRNNTCHDVNKQKKQIKKWLIKEREAAIIMKHNKLKSMQLNLQSMKNGVRLKMKKIDNEFKET